QVPCRQEANVRINMKERTGASSEAMSTGNAAARTATNAETVKHGIPMIEVGVTGAGMIAEAIDPLTGTGRVALLKTSVVKGIKAVMIKEIAADLLIKTGTPASPVISEAGGTKDSLSIETGNPAIPMIFGARGSVVAPPG